MPSRLPFVLWSPLSRARECLAALSIAVSASAEAAEAQSWKSLGDSPGDIALEAYFKSQTLELASQGTASIRTAADWQAQRGNYQRQLKAMLGLDPEPPRTPLSATITGSLQRDGVRVEKLHFQSRPGLYVTANLYLPERIDKPLPAIVYVCGHAQVKTNGVSYGNKTAYQHHGIWFARNGYACLTLDTLQLGEIEGLHHGIYRQGRWWWNSRGYTPAGVEAWNSIRAIDYLETRPEVDATRIGMTGRSGGGSYTWTTAAIDERVKVAVPVAGITDMQNQVVDGCIEGHCDCMFFVNTHRWDFDLNAALIAPRPLLIANTDADSIFPLDGVVRLQQRVHRIYDLLGAGDKLGLAIAPGPHKDIQELQVAAFRFFNQHLKHEDTPVERTGIKGFTPAELRVFKPGEEPADARNATIDQTFVPAATRTVTAPLETILGELRSRSFHGWPADAPVGSPELVEQKTREGIRYEHWQLTVQPGVTLPLLIASNPSASTPRTMDLHVLEENSPADGWSAWASAFAAVSGITSLGEPPVGTAPQATVNLPALFESVRTEGRALAVFAPRGVGPTAWTANPTKRVQIRRRFALLGQTVDGMRVWDIRSAMRVLQTKPWAGAALTVHSKGPMAINVVYASLFEPPVQGLRLDNSPASHREGPDYLNVLTALDIPETLALARTRCALEITGPTPP